MSKILILNIPMHGHINPTIALTKELVKRGHDVTYLINEEFREKIAPTGAKIITYEVQNDKKLFKRIFTVMSTIYYKALEIGKNFDCIIYEMGFFFGAKLGEELGIKTVCLTSTFALNNKITDDFAKGKSFLHKIMEIKLLRKLLSIVLIKDKKLRHTDLMYELIDHNPDLNIVYTSRQFQIHNEDFDEKHFVFIGPSVGGRIQDSDIPFDKMKSKIIYISLGTVSTNSLKFFKTCIGAFKNTDVSVIMSIGKQIDIEDLGTIPNNFYVYPFVPQVAVLEHADLFVTHCGMNSANEAMYYAVPIIGIPQRADQPIVANRMVQLGLGEMIDKKHVTADNLKERTMRVLKDSTYKTNMTKMREEMLSSGGYMKAADEIEKYIYEDQFAYKAASS
ncbi:glycosyltransferase [Clostridium pasteurianum]|jgi:MGT family glycosyltransferase|uniref:macrolide family glycosyltransferase n=1 Tax=Clostridium pasteurianum TaxID=1501 RepID=UPI00226102B8|nr:macrolide family glycosyltransferase [Clostridium pasteurianum]UZW14741.1 glycosyltransferase [Clostridium pasteurianum]